MFTLQLNGTDQNAMLVCSATGGYPPITNISLLKNGDVIASSASESTLQVNTADLPPSISHYGLYVCLVDLSGIPLQQNVMLKKKGSYDVTGFADLVMTLLSSLRVFRSTTDTTGHEQWLMHCVDCKWHGNGARTYRQSVAILPRMDNKIMA